MLYLDCSLIDAVVDILTGKMKLGKNLETTGQYNEGGRMTSWRGEMRTAESDYGSPAKESIDAGADFERRTDSSSWQRSWARTLDWWWGGNPLRCYCPCT